MKQVIIEKPIINSPFQEPTQHFRFSQEGITDQIEPGSRPGSFFVPIPKPKKKGNKYAPEIQWSTERAEENECANQDRGPVPAGVNRLIPPALVLPQRPLENVPIGGGEARADPFPQPDTGKITVKLINNIGGEVVEVDD